MCNNFDIFDDGIEGFGGFFSAVEFGGFLIFPDLIMIVLFGVLFGRKHGTSHFSNSSIQ